MSVCLIAVELPPWFSSMSLALESDVDLVSLCTGLLITYKCTY